MTTSKTRQLVLAFTIALGTIAMPGSTDPAFASDAREMCSGDAMRLCSSEIPDIPRITACMHRKRAQLSAGCRAIMDRDANAGRKSKRAAAFDD